MILHALAVDYDGTIAEHGRVSAATAASLARVRASSRRCLLVTGRMLPDLRAVCPDLDAMFDGVVAENGALLYLPARGEVRALADAPEPALVDALRRRGVRHELGTAIVATTEEYTEPVRAAIRETGVPRALVFNKGALMLLPDGVSKGTGLAAALAVMGLSPHNAAAIGDAENDQAFLAVCECGVAVADAVPALRRQADHVTRGGVGAGVVEFVDEHLLRDAVEIVPRLARHQLPLGHTAAGGRVSIPAHATGLLVVGPPASGKSTLTGLLVERLAEAGRAFCVMDPEGDHGTLAGLDGVLIMGGAGRPSLPGDDDLRGLLRRPAGRLVLDLSALSVEDRIAYTTLGLTAVAAARRTTGLPHWLIVDGAQSIARGRGASAVDLVRPAAESLALVSPSADRMAVDARRVVDTVVSTDAEVFHETLATLRADHRRDTPLPDVPGGALRPGEAVLASLGANPLRVTRFTVGRRTIEHRRHRGAYAERDLAADRGFHVRGPREQTS